MMKFFGSTALLAAGILLAAGSASAQDVSDSQTVTFGIEAFRAISVSGNPGALVITGAEPGSEPTSVSDATTTWAVSTNESNLKVTGQIPTAMPNGVTLSVGLAAPAGAASQGSQALGVAAVELVTGIAEVDETGLTITYTLDATSNAGVVASDTRVVTLTLTAGA